ncbi:MAG: tetratricopeptide repeat protein [Spirochaetes bacterium]|nr:tetratricopeptide repeat protein [Spirochaetota bacterium]
MYKLKVFKYSFFIAGCLFCLASVPALGNSEELERIADDARFSNAYYLVTIDRKDKAITLLSEYIEVYINGAHRKKALLTIADIYFERFDYLRATNFYMMLFEEYPNSEEGVEAYYRTGLSYVKMGDRKRASEIFGDIVDNYAQFAAADKARLEHSITVLLSE